MSLNSSPKEYIRGKCYAKVNIMGDEWKYSVMDDAERKALGERRDVRGFTDLTNKLIYVHTDHLNEITVVHELIHVFMLYCRLDAVALSNGQHEEIFCEVVAHNLKTINKLKVEMLKKLRKL